MSRSVPVRAYIGLGSNLNQPMAQLQQASAALAGIPATELHAISPYYASAPLGPADQPEYVNAVACLDTTLDAHALLRALQSIENAQGRVRTGQRWGPRTLDLDLLLFGTRQIDTPDLQVPHPGIPERAFVLYPLADIAPASLEIPGQGRLEALLSACAPEGIRRIEVA